MLARRGPPCGQGAVAGEAPVPASVRRWGRSAPARGELATRRPVRRGQWLRETTGPVPQECSGDGVSAPHSDWAELALKRGDGGHCVARETFGDRRDGVVGPQTLGSDLRRGPVAFELSRDHREPWAEMVTRAVSPRWRRRSGSGAEPGHVLRRRGDLRQVDAELCRDGGEPG